LIWISPQMGAHDFDLESFILFSYMLITCC
jgi:hypothetical protein